MKINAALARTLLMAASIGMVVPLRAQTTPKTKPAPAPKQQTPPAAADAKKKAPDKGKAAPAPETTEPEPVIAGSTITRADGTFLGLSLEGGNFKLSFYDAKKKPVQANVARAAARWDPVTTAGQERVVLNPIGDGTALSGPKQVRPPLCLRFISRC
jgi:hypothetical protein